MFIVINLDNFILNCCDLREFGNTPDFFQRFLGLLYFFDDYSSGVVDFYDTQQPKLIGSGVALNEWIAGCNLNKSQKCYLQDW